MTPGSGQVSLSVIIPARNAAHLIGDQLAALMSQTWERPWEIVVVDNGSTDGTGDVVRRRQDAGIRLRVVDAMGGQGAAYARNVGVSHASGSMLAFCDADDVVGDGWVAAMGDALSDHDAVTGPLELDLLNPPWLADSRGRAHTVAPATFEGVFPFASSCNLGIRRSVFDHVGGFDPDLRVAPGEDLELSLRLWLAGVALRFEPRAVVHYRYRASLRSGYQQAVAYGRVRPLLGERLRQAERPGLRRTAGFRNWLWLARHLPLLRSRVGRARWLWVAGQRIGNLAGSVRVRRLYL